MLEYYENGELITDFADENERVLETKQWKFEDLRKYLQKFFRGCGTCLSHPDQHILNDREAYAKYTALESCFDYWANHFVNIDKLEDTIENFVSLKRCKEELVDTIYWNFIKQLEVNE